MRARGSLLLLLVVAGDAAADGPDLPPLSGEARVHLEAGLKLYEAHRYDEAVEEVRAARAIDPRPELSYTLGQIERHRGDCAAAIAHFRTYLAEAVDPAGGRAAQTLLEECEKRLAPPRVPPPVAVAPAPPPPSPPPSLPPWWRDRVGAGLAVSGLLLLGGGAALIGDCVRRAGRAGDRYDRYADAARWVPWEAAAGGVAAAIGAALVGAAVVRYAERRPRRAIAWAPSPTAGGLQLTVGGAF